MEVVASATPGGACRPLWSLLRNPAIMQAAPVLQGDRHMMSMIKIGLVVLLGLPAVLSVMTLPATVMALSGINGVNLESRLSLCFAFLVLVYPAVYGMSVVFLYTTGRWGFLYIPAAALVVAGLLWGAVTLLQAKEQAQRDALEEAVQGVLHEQYAGAVQLRTDYSSHGKGDGYLCRLYDDEDGNVFLVQFETLEPERIASAVEREREAKNAYVARHEALAARCAEYVDTSVVVASDDGHVALYVYTTTTEFVTGDMTPVGQAINAAKNCADDVFIVLGGVPNDARSGYVNYASRSSATPLQDRIRYIADSASFRIVQAGEEHAQNVFARHSGMVPALVMREAQDNTNASLAAFAEEQGVRIVNGALDYADGQIVVRGEYAKKESGETGKYTYHFMTLHILLGE